jgi:cell wall-associated NlpC family hydrolase
VRSTEPGWASQYVGAPFVEHGRDPATGWDCWGLLVYVYREHLGITLPDFDGDYEDTEDVAQIARLFDRGLVDWREVPEADARPFDGVLVEMLGRPSHCAVYVATGRMLHTLHGSETSVIRVRSHLWKPTGFFRFEPSARTEPT